MLRRKVLKSGYTTGACAAAAAKAATILLLSAEARKRGSAKGEEKDFRVSELQSLRTGEVEIPFPDGSRHRFRMENAGYRADERTAFASIIKDAGDDPDVTNGAVIAAEAKLIESELDRRESSHCPLPIAHCPLPIVIRGGKGVGIVTKPGLSVPVGEAAINPVPRRMIEEAVREAISDCGLRIADCGIIPNSEFRIPKLVVTISVPLGEELAKKTLNPRLGIISGISILGTSGIVRPLSNEAWTASITASMDVAKASGCREIVFSAGRISERAHMKKFDLPEEAYVMMGDYLEFSLLDAKKHDFERIHLCAQWAKMLKTAMSTPQTHVRHGAIDVKKAVALLNRLGIAVPEDRDFNTAREIFDVIASSHHAPGTALSTVCRAAKEYAETVTGGTPVVVHLVSYQGELLANSE